MGGYDGHLASVGGAREAIEGVQAVIRAAIERHENAMAAIIDAAGEAPTVESARNAFEMAMVAKERLEDALRTYEVANQELIRYGNGF